MVMILVFLVSIAAKWYPVKIAETASITVSVLYFLTAIAFGAYGNLLSKELDKLGHNSSASTLSSRSTQDGFDQEDKPKFRCPQLTLPQRIRVAAIIVPLCFIGESCIWIASAYISGNVILTSLFGVMDLIALWTILFIFYHSVSKTIEQAHRSINASTTLDQVSRKKSGHSQNHSQNHHHHQPRDQKAAVEMEPLGPFGVPGDYPLQQQQRFTMDQSVTTDTTTPSFDPRSTIDQSSRSTESM